MSVRFQVDESAQLTKKPSKLGMSKPKLMRMQSRLATILQDKEEKSSGGKQRQTKIVCTLGPSTQSVEKIKELLKAGMNVARLNFSHGSHSYHATSIENVREAVKQTGIPCAIMLDTKGPEIRTGLLKNNGAPVQVTKGQTLNIITDGPETFEGDNKTIYIDYKNLPKVVKVGGIIRIDDGLINMKVTEITGECSLTVEVQNTAMMGQKKGTNLPGAKVDLPGITEKDKEDFAFGVAQGIDCIAASFTRTAAMVREMREQLGERGKDIKIIAKIENQEGMENLDEIVEEADGIMVARGDLGVEIPIQKVFTAQKKMIRKCNIAGKPVITATQMLESMVSNPRPTRAEAGDVANAVFDGTDCVMLSGETAKGDYPLEAVEVMARICKTAEHAVDYREFFQQIVYYTPTPMPKTEAITSAAVKAACDLEVKVIVVLTVTGGAARAVAKYMPPMPIIAVTSHQMTARQCLLSRGVFPLLVDETEFKNTKDVASPTAADLSIPVELRYDSYGSNKLLLKGIEFAKSRGWVSRGDGVVFVTGAFGGTATTNTLKILTVP